jgi:hypothetical protein
VFKAHCWLLFVMVAFAGKAFPAADPLAVEVNAIPVSEDYVLRTWGVDEGLPSNRVTSLTQTPDGYLWVGTLGGLTRFDGVRFTIFDAENTPAWSRIGCRRCSPHVMAACGWAWIGEVSPAGSVIDFT